MPVSPKANLLAFNRMKDFGSDRSSWVRLDKNERTVSFSEADHEAILERITPVRLSMYPDQSGVYQRLAELHDVPEDWILLFPGSDASVKAIYETYVAPGDHVVYLTPTYAMIQVYASLYEADVTGIGYDADLNLDFDGLLSSITDRTRIVFIANPNQPTGTVLSRQQLDLLVAASKEANALLVLDEAYETFANMTSGLEYVRENDHVVVQRTFSKASGIAAARLGYVVASPEVTQWLFRVKTLSDINVLALAAAEYLLDEPHVVASYVADVLAGKEILNERLPALGITVTPSEANFLHMQLPDGYDLPAVRDAMRKRGFLIRITGDGLPATLAGCVRITVGPAQQMSDFVSALSQTMDELR